MESTLLTTLQAIFLGIVEGMTEFIPVSSTGHLLFLTDLMNFQGPPGKVFEVVIQLGAILAICWYYREKLINTVKKLPHDKQAQRFAINVMVGFLPAAVIGALAHSYIKEVLFSPLIVAIMLILGGILIIAIEKMPHLWIVSEVDGLTWKRSLAIGFCQCLAMIPGTSRSGATIMGAILLGVQRKAAAEFSFFLAIPTMLGATVYDTYKNWDTMTTDGALVILVGFASAFIAALLVIKVVLAYISTHDFKPFGWYRIAAGLVMLVIVLA